MQEALPYKSWLPIHPKNPINLSSSSTSSLVNHTTTTTTKSQINHEFIIKGSKADMKSMVSENAIIVFGRRGCCMSHVVKRLLQGLGVNPAIYEVDEEDEIDAVDELAKIGSGDGQDVRVQFPAVFIGGKLFGGLDRIMATHITGELIPILKEAGALWL